MDAKETKMRSLSYLRDLERNAERGCSILDAESFGEAVRALRSTRGREAYVSDGSEEDPSTGKEILALFARILEIVSLKDQPEMIKCLVDALVELTSLETAGSNREQPGHDTIVAQHAYDALFRVVQRRHGDTREISAIVLRALSPNLLLGYGGAGRQGKPVPSPPKWRWSVQEETLGFVHRLGESVPESKDGISGLVRHVALRCPDKADYRTSAVASISSMFQHLVPEERRKVVLFMYKLSRTSKPAQRLVAIESAGVILSWMEEPSGERVGGWHASEETPDAKRLDREVTCGQLCMSVLVQRSSDKVPAVRGRALASLVEVFENYMAKRSMDDAVEILKNTEASHPSLPIPDGTSVPSGSGTHMKTLPENLFDTLIRILYKRCRDEKGTVRKPATILLGQLLRSQQKKLCFEDLEALEASCLDPLVSVRKVALGVVTQLAEKMPHSKEISRLWLECGLPLICDSETSVQEKALEMVDSQLLSPLLEKQLLLDIQSGALTLAEPPRALQLLVSAGESPLFASHVRQAFQLLVSQKRLDGKRLGTALQRVMGQTQSKCQAVAEEDSYPYSSIVLSLWTLAAELSKHFPKAVTWEFMVDTWTSLRKSKVGSNSKLVGLVLTAIANAACFIPPERAEKLSEDFMAILQRLELDPSLIAVHVSTAATLSKGDVHWGVAIAAAAEAILQSYVLPCQQDPRPSAKKVAAALFTYGELSLVLETTFKQETVTYVQALLGPSLADGRPVPASLQAHSWTSLGKLCLIDEVLAKKCIPMFIQELEGSGAAAVRNNILVALSDLMVKHTALVDSHVMRLAALVQDPCEVIRRQSLVLLANLLQRDYLRWRVALLQHVLVATVDDSPMIRSMADHLMKDFLPTKAPLLVYNSFIEIMCNLNGCAPISATGIKVEKEQVLFIPHLQGIGESARKKRASIYRSMIGQMLPEHRLATGARLATEILAAVADGNISLEETRSVVTDALEVLSWKEVRSMSRPQGEDDDATSEILLQAQGKLVAQVVKKNLIENILPILIQLKHTMENQKSPLLAPLMVCFRELMKQHKNEVQVLLAADPQLAKEVSFDIRQAEEAKSKPEFVGSSPSGSPKSCVDALKKADSWRTPRRSSVVGVTGSSPLAAEVLQSAAADGLGSPSPVAPFIDAPPSRRRSMLAKTPSSSPGSEQYKSMSVPRLRSRSRLGMALSTDGKNRRESFGCVQDPESFPDENMDSINKTVIPTPLPIRAYSDGVQKPCASDLRIADVTLPSPDRPVQTLPKWNIDVEVKGEITARGRKRQASKSP